MSLSFNPSKKTVLGSIVAFVAASAAAVALFVNNADAATTVVLDGVTVTVPDGGTQIITVNAKDKTYANVRYWTKADGRWTQQFMTTKGRIGAGGVVPRDQRKQGTSTTPLGTFSLMSTFGTHSKASTQKLAHTKITSESYWVQDNESAYYNRYRLKSQGGFRYWLPTSDINSSERLAAYPTQYEYSVVIKYNYDKPVRYRGAGIFLHVNGSGATGGCVSVPRWMMIELFSKLDPAKKPVIAIGA
ncbi:L,D-transpeptidase family protein [Nocardioides sp. WG-D5]